MSGLGNTKTIRVDISLLNTNAIGWSTFSNSRMWKRRSREKKKLRAGHREKKNKLVESVNPGWKDLAVDWYSKGLMKDGVLVDVSKIKA